MTDATCPQRALDGASSTHAIVIGGSIAGLLAARVLLDHFDQVILFERDQFPEQPTPRPGVPQGHHVHALLMQGQQILEQLFPGIIQELVESGAIPLDWIADWKFLSIEGWLEQHDSGLQGLCCTRLLLEWQVRQRLMQSERCHLRPGVLVQGVMFREQPRPHVTGVSLRPRSEAAEPDESGAEMVSADLVVDATGRNSKLPQWLSSMGYEKPLETTVNSFLGYASRWYRQPTRAIAQGIIISAKPGETTRGGVCYPVEGDRWIVTLSGVSGDHPPNDEAGFLAFAQSLRDPSIYDAIRSAEPCSPIQCYRRTENQWRHYEHLTAMPGGIVALGDAVCCFNPVYGQGMTAAALGAMTLRGCLQQFHPIDRLNQQHPWERTFQRRLAKALETPWLMATGEDFRWEKTEGQRPGWLAAKFQGYFDRVLSLAETDSEAHRAFIEVAHLVKPPTALFAPGILWQVLRSPFKG
ncbi:MAG: 2-polyprenyl-6-methoxyphenol hydroxylase-like oxidoreductase [Leptolyngbyaceae bacterium]|nr:2-polyprenyl-6-methoxyphenol hydroxylase-like oxidoreductase [Leptolyngbyaceae bacterium]